MANSNVIPFSPRLPMPEGVEGLDQGKWRVLTDAIFPSARTTEAVVMAIDYCRARGLDVFKRPVHIVPMWSSAVGDYIETVWPGINELLVTASRTKVFAGIDKPLLGPMVMETFTGRKKVWSDQKNKYVWEELSVTVTYPEWAELTVYRMVQGKRCPFTERLYWLETYARDGGRWSKLPTEMWERAPVRQFIKCVKAAVLRTAFPEECSDYVAEEMEGRETDMVPPNGVIVPKGPLDEDAVSSSAPVEASQETKAWIAELITAARERGGAWAAAVQTVKSRLDGADLAYGLAEIDRAKLEQEPAKPANPAASVSDEIKARTAGIIQQVIQTGAKWEAAIAAVKKALKDDQVARDYALGEIEKARLQQKSAA